MATNDLWDFSTEANPLIATEERIPDRLRNENARAKVRHVAADVFEDQPAFVEGIGSLLSYF
jgi:hypothetical protein